MKIYTSVLLSLYSCLITVISPGTLPGSQRNISAATVAHTATSNDSGSYKTTGVRIERKEEGWRTIRRDQRPSSVAWPRDRAKTIFEASRASPEKLFMCVYSLLDPLFTYFISLIRPPTGCYRCCCCCCLIMGFVFYISFLCFSYVVSGTGNYEGMIFLWGDDTLILFWKKLCRRLRCSII